MEQISNAAGALCEIKYALNGVTICTGSIMSVSGSKLCLKNAILFAHDESFAGIITILSPLYGFRVYKADIQEITSEYVVVENIQYVVNLDRRFGYRAVVNIPAIVVSENDPGVAIDAVIQNISASGILISMHRPFQIKEDIKVRFPLDPKHPHTCTVACCVVRRSDNLNHGIYQYGCKFSSMSDTDRRLVISYMNNLRIKQLRRMVD